MRKRMECRWAKKSQRSLRGARSNQRGSVSHPLVWGQSLHMGASAIRIWVSVDRHSGSKNLGSQYSNIKRKEKEIIVMTVT